MRPMGSATSCLGHSCSSAVSISEDDILKSIDEETIERAHADLQADFQEYLPLEAVDYKCATEDLAIVLLAVASGVTRSSRPVLTWLAHPMGTPSANT